MIDQRNSSTISNDSSFYVVMHDAAPCFSTQISVIVDALAPLIATRIAAAVVPSWHGKPIAAEDGAFVDLVKDRFDDVLLHGLTHSRSSGGGLVSFLTGGADEFNGLTPEETESRLERGQAAMREQFKAPACGFIAPTFQRGRLTAERLARFGLNYVVGFRHIDFADGSRIPVATWCWDMGSWRALGHAGHFYGNLRMRLYRNLLPCLAIHPVDVDRGFLPHIVKLTQRLLDEGRSPILFDRGR